MKFVKITVDGHEYTLVQNSDGIWTVTNRAPLTAGDYVMTVTVTAENGREIVIDTTDEELLRAVTLLVRNGDTDAGVRMLDYYPEVIKKIYEFQALMYAEGFEVDFAKSDIDMVANEAWLQTMGHNSLISCSRYKFLR